jgi:hypothetical protein
MHYPEWQSNQRYPKQKSGVPTTAFKIILNIFFPLEHATVVPETECDVLLLSEKKLHDIRQKKSYLFYRVINRQNLQLNIPISFLYNETMSAEKEVASSEKT